MTDARPLAPPSPDRELEAPARELLAALRRHHRATAEHSERIAAGSGAVARWLGLDPDEAVGVELVGRLHDIGKLAVPAALLDLERPLERAEREVVRAHSVAGEEILMRTAGLHALAPAVRAAHECWDGSGYPDGLAGTAIPLAARIVGTVDAFDAMTNDRPYRRALAPAEARRRIAAGAGVGFDPDVVAALLDVVG